MRPTDLDEAIEKLRTAVLDLVKFEQSFLELSVTWTFKSRECQKRFVEAITFLGLQ